MLDTTPDTCNVLHKIPQWPIPQTPRVSIHSNKLAREHTQVYPCQYFSLLAAFKNPTGSTHALPCLPAEHGPYLTNLSNFTIHAVYDYLGVRAGTAWNDQQSHRLRLPCG